MIVIIADQIDSGLWVFLILVFVWFFLTIRDYLSLSNVEEEVSRGHEFQPERIACQFSFTWTGVF